MDGDLRLTRRQKTAIQALLADTLAGTTDDQLGTIAERLFEPLEHLDGPDRRGFVREALRRMTECASVEARALEALGALCEREDRWAEAADAYQAAWARQSDSAPRRLAARLGWARIKLGELEAAATFLEGAIEARPDDELEKLLHIARSPSSRA